MSLNYKGQKLFIDNISIKGIASKNITPFYVYSYKKIKDNYETFYNYFKKVNPLVCFSVKSNSNVSILSELGKLGSGADVVSEGELLKALKKIENVNAESVKNIAQLIVSRPLTISSIGPIKKLETLDKIQDRLK